MNYSYLVIVQFELNFKPREVIKDVRKQKHIADDTTDSTECFKWQRVETVKEKGGDFLINFSEALRN